MMSKLKRIRDALVSIEGLQVYHYWRYVKDAPYCIWQEYSGNELEAENKIIEQAFAGSIDYYTNVEYDETVEKIQEALNMVDGLVWHLDDVLFEDDTNLIHYNWTWRLV